MNLWPQQVFQVAAREQDFDGTLTVQKNAINLCRCRLITASTWHGSRNFGCRLSFARILAPDPLPCSQRTEGRSAIEKSSQIANSKPPTTQINSCSTEMLLGELQSLCTVPLWTSLCSSCPSRLRASSCPLDLYHTLKTPLCCVRGKRSRPKERNGIKMLVQGPPEGPSGLPPFSLQPGSPANAHVLRHNIAEDCMVIARYMYERGTKSQHL